MVDDLRNRSTADVFDDHLRLAAEHRFEEDIERNVSPDIVILERRGVFRGHEGARKPKVAPLMHEGERGEWRTRGGRDRPVLNGQYCHIGDGTGLRTAGADGRAGAAVYE